MKKTKMPLSKKLLTAAGVLILLLAVCAGAFFWYVSDYYRAEDVALEVLSQDSGRRWKPSKNLWRRDPILQKAGCLYAIGGSSSRTRSCRALLVPT